ncbi:MAG: hypothetical protein AMJ89_04990 [candidate division Zixibacteria bacterium SM23_73]|nr:MAG: hypothetical protein AMJ89_04990 [candidate division Zixibacteria bacterium SM23_73]
MRPSNPKVSFDPRLFVAKKILSLVVLFCFLVLFSLVYAGGNSDSDIPFGEHPWDDLRSGADYQYPEPPKISEVKIFPCGGWDGVIIIHLPQKSKGGNMEKDRVPIQPSAKNQNQIFILF